MYTFDELFERATVKPLSMSREEWIIRQQELGMTQYSVDEIKEAVLIVTNTMNEYQSVADKMWEILGDTTNYLGWTEYLTPEGRKLFDLLHKHSLPINSANSQGKTKEQYPVQTWLIKAQKISKDTEKARNLLSSKLVED